MNDHQSLKNNPRVFIEQKNKTIFDTFESISTKIKEKHSGKSKVSDSKNKIYASVQKKGYQRKDGTISPAMAIYFGRNVCLKARFMQGDLIEIMYDKYQKKWGFRRTNKQEKGFTLSSTGGRDEKSNTFVCKCKYDTTIFPHLNGSITEFTNITINDEGIICS